MPHLSHRLPRLSPRGLPRPDLRPAARLGHHVYLLGLSYGAVADALGGLGLDFSKSSAYRAVQAAAAALPDLRRNAVWPNAAPPCSAPT